MYSQLEMYSFADFYHRFSNIGLTLDEIFENWSKYSNNKRDINDPVKVPKKLKEKVINVKPSALQLLSVLKKACVIKEVTREEVNGKARDRKYVEVRQWVAFVGTKMGFEPPDFERILGWERSGIYHKREKAEEVAYYNVNYRNSLNELLSIFGFDTLIA